MKDQKMKNNTPEKKNYDPIAVLLKDEISGQIKAFLDTPKADRAKFAEDTLFVVKPYPAHLAGCEGADTVDVYLLERSCRMRRDDPNEHGRMTCSILCLDREKHTPRFYLQAVIMPSDTGMVSVYELDDKGPNYKKTLRWSTRDEEQK